VSVSSVAASDLFDVVNHVPLEDYLPGVLDRELFSHWHPQTYEALSVAARSYAMIQIRKAGNRHYDLESTTKSQVYAGVTGNGRAIDAARATRGLVLTWEGRVFPAFYSSCCGGAGQDGPAVMADSPVIPPLMGRTRHDCCNSSPHFRWGPIVRNRQSLSQRIAAWGRTNRHPSEHVGTIAHIAIGARNRAGRPTRFIITSVSGKTFELGAEEFRFACNNVGQGLSPLPATGILKSSFVEVRVAGDDVWLTDGRGFGHGVGLCQFGAQSLAQRGQGWQAILDYYYPGAEIDRAYK
jgi:stage II sporulation protein D